MTVRKNPFSQLFAVFGNNLDYRLFEGVNDSSMRKLEAALTEPADPSGCVIVIRSPRAGYGKTALLRRVGVELSESHLFLPIRLLNGHNLDSGQLLEDVLSCLSQQLPSHIGLTAIDEVSRKILSKGLEPMIASGEIACQNREESLEALRNNPIETFNFHDHQAATALWVKDNFETVGSRLASELSLLSKATLRDVAYWLELFYRYASTSPSSVARNGQLFETVFGGQERKGPIYTDKLMGLLKLLSLVTRPVLVLDDTEGLSNLPAESLEAISGLVTISQACSGTSVLLCLNLDIWTSAIEPRLPGGLKDRILHKIIDLEPLTEDEAKNLIRSYAGETSGAWIDDLDLGDEPLYSRGVLKKAADAWDDLTFTDSLVSEKDAESGFAIEGNSVDGDKTPKPLDASSPKEVVALPLAGEKEDVSSSMDSNFPHSPEGEEGVDTFSNKVATAPEQNITPREESSAVDDANKVESKAVAETPISPFTASHQEEEASPILFEETTNVEVAESVEAQELDQVSVFQAPVDDKSDAGLVNVEEAAEVESLLGKVEHEAPLENPFAQLTEPLTGEAQSETSDNHSEVTFANESFQQEIVEQAPVQAASTNHVVLLPEEAQVVEPVQQPAQEVPQEEPTIADSPFSTHSGFSPFKEKETEQKKSHLPEPKPKQQELVQHESIVPAVSPFTAASPAVPGFVPAQAVPPTSPFQVAGNEMNPQAGGQFYQAPPQQGVPLTDYSTQANQPVQYVQPAAAGAANPQQPVQQVPESPVTQAAFNNPFEPAPSQAQNISPVDNSPAVQATPPQTPQASFSNPFEAGGQSPQNPAVADASQAEPTPSPVSQPAFVNPFESAQNSSQNESVSEPPVSGDAANAQPFQNPFEKSMGGNDAVSTSSGKKSNEEKRVEDLLEQFKNRYGRD